MTYKDLKSDDNVCYYCGGHGFFRSSDLVCGFDQNCPKCVGSGKLDWIETIVGKKIDPPKETYGLVDHE